MRKDANTQLKKFEKNSEITEDELKNAETKVQKLTDKYVGLIDEILAKKEKELLSI